jgi:hypothetical protein
MNALRPLPSTLLRTGLRLRTRSTATLLSACRHPQSCNLARTMATRSGGLTQSQTPITLITPVRALHASAELGERVENSTALLERTKLREEKIEEENTDNTKPVGGKGSEGIHFKRKPSHLVSQAIGYRMTKANPVLLCRIVGFTHAETDSLLTTVHDLQDPSRTGPWTISHPVYTPEVGLMSYFQNHKGWFCS